MKLKVGVFFGGMSVEHEVSVISAIQAINSIDQNKYEVIPVYITRDNEMYVGENVGNIAAYKDVNKLVQSSQRVNMAKDGNKAVLTKYPAKKFGNNIYSEIDVAFPIVHGTNVEDGTLQGYFKMFNIPYVGCDVTSSAVGMDKLVMKTVLKQYGIPVLDGLRLDYIHYNADREARIQEIEAKIGYPVIVKPVNLGSSVGIGVAADRDKLEEVIDTAFMYATFILVEHAITNLREINCAVLGDYESAQASECEEPITSGEILSYEDKYVNGSKGKLGDGNDTKASGGGMSSLSRKLPAELSTDRREEIRKMAVDTFQALNCSGVSRIDFMIDQDSDKVYVNEINTIPGSLAFYLWEPLGKKYTEVLSDMIDLALKRERETANLTFDFDTSILKNFNADTIKGSGSKF